MATDTSIETWRQVMGNGTPVTPPVESDPLAAFRLQVQEEAVEKSERGKMSDAALAKLRAIKDQERLEAIENERFKNALRSVVVNPENLRKLIERCNTSVPPQQIERRVHKLTWWIEAGYLLGREIDTVGLINLFSGLAPEEEKLSDSNFFSDWKDRDARKRKESRMSRGLVSASDEEHVYRPCKSGKKCIRFEKRKPAPAKGNGEYCSPACAASDKARQKRGLAALPSDSTIN
jgi:hypothetical protein